MPPIADDGESVAAPAKPSRERLQALERGLDALSFLNRYGAGTSTQVAKALQLKRSTAHRILAVLVNMGLLRHDPLNHQYILCGRVGELSNRFRDDDWVLTSALPAMKAWTREHHWPLVLTTPLAGKLVVRASTDYESPISVDRFHCGQVIPVHGSTAGLIYLAHSRAHRSQQSHSSYQAILGVLVGSLVGTKAIYEQACARMECDRALTS